MVESEEIQDKVWSIIEIKGTDLIITGDEESKICIRNSKDLVIIKKIENDFGYLYSGICLENSNISLLGFEHSLVKFDYEQMDFLDKL